MTKDVMSVFMFFNLSSFLLDRFGRQADGQIVRCGTFFYVFMYLGLPMGTGLNGDSFSQKSYFFNQPYN